jgi:hypothetical protein
VFVDASRVAASHLGTDFLFLKKSMPRSVAVSAINAIAGCTRALICYGREDRRGIILGCYRNYTYRLLENSAPRCDQEYHRRRFHRVTPKATSTDVTQRREKGPSWRKKVGALPY